MKRLVSIIFIFCFLNSFSQNASSFFNVKNQLFSYKKIELNNLFLDATFRLSASPKLFFINSNNQTENSTTFLYGCSSSADFKNKLKLIGSVEGILGKQNSLLQNYIDSLHIYPGKGRVLKDGYCTILFKLQK